MAPLGAEGQDAGLLLLGAALVGLISPLLFRRRSPRIAVATGMLALASLTTILVPVFPAPPGREAKSDGHYLTAAQLADVGRFGKPISTAKPEIGVPVTPYRLRIPALSIDSLIEAG